MLASINGKISLSPLESNEIRQKNKFSCQDDVDHLEALVAQMDCVFIGRESIECVSNAFSVKHLRKNRQEIPWIIFSKAKKINAAHHFWQQRDIPKNLFTCTSFDFAETEKIKNIPVPLGLSKPSENANSVVSDVSLFPDCLHLEGNISELFQYLQAQNIHTASLLRGGRLNSSFWKHRLVQTLLLTISPVTARGIVENPLAPSLIDGKDEFFQRLKLRSVTQKSDFIFLNYGT